MNQRRLARHGVALALALGAGLLALVLTALPVMTTVEHKTVDLRLRFRAARPGFGQGVLVVLLDEAAMAPLACRSPVSRQLLASLVDVLDRSGAALIGLDVFLQNPTLPEQDAALVAAMQRSGRVILVGALRADQGDGRLDLPDQMFVKAAAGIGLADLPIDPIDQRVRRAQLWYDIDGQKVPAFATALYLAAERIDIADGRYAIPDFWRQRMPALELDSQRRFFIDYQAPSSSQGAAGGIAVLPASAVASGMIPAPWIAGKVVLVGAGYEDNTDSYRTPFYSPRFDYALMPGVQIHANALASIQNGRAIGLVDPAAALALVLAAGLLLLAVERRFNTVAAGLVLVLASAGYAAAAFAVFEARSLALPLVPVFLAMVLSFVFLAIYRSLTEGRQKRWIQSAFQMYLSPEFVNILVNRPDLLDLGGQEQELTILFSDLQGFTSLSEGLSPAELVHLLNDYLDGMTQILLNHGGTLDKFEGDAIMAFWGAPVAQPDHARRAVAAALDMLAFSQRFSDQRERQGLSPMITRIGINTGKVIVGNIGSTRRFNYTVIGDEVNLASRLEGANKAYGSTLMISQATGAQVGDAFLLRELDDLRVKGKAKPVKVYQVLGPATQLLTQAEMVKRFHQARARYLARDWDGAGRLFEQILADFPDDEPSRAYVQRCRYLAASPPPENWDGVFELKTK